MHRDIKPANVMIDLETDLVKVTDFGIARIADSSRTRTGMVLGTRRSSPSRWPGAAWTARSGSARLGRDRLPAADGTSRTDDSMAALMYEIANQTPPDVRNWRPGASPSRWPCRGPRPGKASGIVIPTDWQMAADLTACARYVGTLPPLAVPAKGGFNSGGLARRRNKPRRMKAQFAPAVTQVR